MHYLLPHLVDRAADARPEAPAVCFGAETLGYGNLAARANAMAHLLVELGVRRGDRVALFMGKGIDCAVALYAIMKAGAAYTPLDPAAPPARLAFVLRDCGVRVLFTDGRRSRALRALAGEGVALDWVIGEDPHGQGPFPVAGAAQAQGFPAAHPPPVGATEQDLAYILYTSGSTGVPKGIVHTHRSALAWAEVSAHSYALTAQDRVSNYAPLHFDLSTLDYFGTAAAGAATVIVPENVMKLPASLAQFIEESALSVFYTVPLALVQLVAGGHLAGRRLERLRWVLFGGEPMPVKHLREIMGQLPRCRFANVYGPTETNGCTHFVVPDLDAWGDEPLPIGRGYDNVETLIVDADDRPVGRGETGELLIRAPTLMLGYWRRDDLNASASYWRERLPGLPDRFHRTGDLVQQRDDGSLRFLGRRDRQVKVRGYRVELDEVESVLVAHSEVERAAVYPVPDAGGMLAIHAAVVPAAGCAPDVAELRRHLARQLPAYALPTGIELVTALPLTSTGKTDRRALARRAAGAPA